MVLTAHQPQARLRPLTFSTESVQSYKPQSVNSRNLFRSCLMKLASVPEATPPSVTKNLEETAETAKCKPEWTDCQPAHRKQIYESLTVLEITFDFFHSNRMGRLPPRGQSGSSVLGKASFFFSAASLRGRNGKHIQKLVGCWKRCTAEQCNFVQLQRTC